MPANIPTGSQASRSNTGHGHVTPRDDGARARCGGPALCPVCAEELAALEAAKPQDPTILVPPGFQGTDAEAVGLAVVGAVAAIQRERDLAVASLTELADAFPETSWAQDSMIVERARALLRELAREPEPAPLAGYAGQAIRTPEEPQT